MLDLLVLNWRERLAEAQTRQSAALLRAAHGDDSRAVDECLRDCDLLSEIHRLAVRLADAQWQAGWLAHPPNGGAEAGTE